MATIASLMSEYEPLYRSLPSETPYKDAKDKYDTMVNYLNYVQETPEEELEEANEP
jgi:hypothetical protein